MEKRLLLLIILLLPIILFGQRKYKYEYRQHLTSQQSTFTTETTDTLLETGESILTFQILDKKREAIPFATVTLKNGSTDTTISSDSNGFVSAKLTSGTFSISIFSLQFTPITLDNFSVEGNTATTIKTTLGQSNLLRIALIYSVKKLTDEEIEKLIDDLSNDKDDNELIKNKSCFVMWEI